MVPWIIPAQYFFSSPEVLKQHLPQYKQLALYLILILPTQNTSLCDLLNLSVKSCRFVCVCVCEYVHVAVGNPMASNMSQPIKTEDTNWHMLSSDDGFPKTHEQTRGVGFAVQQKHWRINQVLDIASILTSKCCILTLILTPAVDHLGFGEVFV